MTVEAHPVRHLPAEAVTTDGLGGEDGASKFAVEVKGKAKGTLPGKALLLPGLRLETHLPKGL